MSSASGIFWTLILFITVDDSVIFITINNSFGLFYEQNSPFFLFHFGKSETTDSW